jgi:hypothetical protein
MNNLRKRFDDFAIWLFLFGILAFDLCGQLLDSKIIATVGFVVLIGGASIVLLVDAIRAANKFNESRARTSTAVGRKRGRKAKVNNPANVSAGPNSEPFQGQF